MYFKMVLKSLKLGAKNGPKTDVNSNLVKNTKNTQK